MRPNDALFARLGLSPEQFSGVTDDSRLLRSGALFLAYPGQGVDRRQYIPDVIAAGARGVLWAPDDGFVWNPAWKVANAPVEGLRALAGYLAHQVAGYPSEHLSLYAITGTNGKTTVSQCLAQVYPEPCTVIGTLGAGFPGQLQNTGFTTPEATTLATLLAGQYEQGARACAMEASSIGIEEGRLNGVRVDTALFTNLTQDHLDYHGDMEAYARAKEKLFTWPGLRLAILNLDDPFGQHLARVTTAQKVLGYTREGSGGVMAVLSARHIVQTSLGQAFELQTPRGNVRVETTLMGAYNLSNLLAVAAVLLDRGLVLSDLAGRLAQVVAPPGRMERYGGEGVPLVMVDYAHTPDALLNALTVLRPVASQRQGRLVCVFGCGGERDREKRPVMGEIALHHADQVWITSDNPRHESPLEIIAQIHAGASGAVVVPDRALAIKQAIAQAEPADVLLIAGKGHETDQEIAGVRYPFVDASHVQQALVARMNVQQPVACLDGQGGSVRGKDGE